MFRREVQEVSGIVQTALDNTRSFSQALHPSILDDYGLDEALAWYVERFGKQVGLVIRYEKQGGAPRLDRQAAVHVYRIVQEALTNVSRHSEAGEAVVRMRCEQERLRVEVEDRGVGLRLSERRGLGVVAMKERADILQGTLRLEQPAEGGTRVVLEVPLASAPAA
jgi:signal transduction histidine kinase